MTLPKLTLTGPLARAARALVETSTRDIAAAAGLKREALRGYERRRVTLSETELLALRVALEEHGAHFVADGVGTRGYGVRLKFSIEKTRRVEDWEDEGGSAANDDV